MFDAGNMWKQCCTHVQPAVALQIYFFNAEEEEKHLKHAVFKEAAAR